MTLDRHYAMCLLSKDHLFANGVTTIYHMQNSDYYKALLTLKSDGAVLSMGRRAKKSKGSNAALRPDVEETISIFVRSCVIIYRIVIHERLPSIRR